MWILHVCVVSLCVSLPARIKCNAYARKNKGWRWRSMATFRHLLLAKWKSIPNGLYPSMLISFRLVEYAYHHLLDMCQENANNTTHHRNSSGLLFCYLEVQQPLLFVIWCLFSIFCFRFSAEPKHITHKPGVRKMLSSRRKLIQVIILDVASWHQFENTCNNLHWKSNYSL